VWESTVGLNTFHTVWQIFLWASGWGMAELHLRTP